MPVDPHEPRGSAHSAPTKKPKPKPTPDVVFGPSTAFAAKVSGAKTVDTTKSKPSIDHPSAGVTVKPDAGVVSRQRFLRAKGYHVVVDGINGPATQAAWNAYQASLHASAPVQANVQQRREQQAAQTKQAIQQRTKIVAQEHAAHVATQAKAKAAELSVQARKTAAIVAAQRKVQAELAKAGKKLPNHGSPQRFDVGEPFTNEPAPLSAVVLQTRKALAFASAARKKPPEKLTPDELVAITVDPLTGSLDPQKPAEVRIVQRYLRAHGHPALALDGVWGRQTFEALKTEMNAAHMAQQARQRQEIIDTFYKPGIVKAGDKGFPVLGVAPSPGELLRILQAPASFASGIILKELLRRAYQGDAGWQHFREQQLQNLEVSVGRRLRLNKDHTFDVFSDPLIHRDFQQRLTDIEAGAVSTLSPLVADQFIREVGSLGSARNVEDLGLRLKTVQRQAEAHFREQMQSRTKDTPWWQDALDAIGKPSEWTATAAENTYQAIIEVASHGARADQAAVQERTIEMRKNHPWANLGLQMALDPLWLAGGLPLAGLSVGAQFAVRMERLGYAIEEGGRLIPVVRTLAAESLKLPAQAGRAAVETHVALKAGTESDPVLRLMQIDHVYNFAVKATVMKRDAVSLARANVRHAMYHGFSKVDNVPFFPIPATIRKRIADTELGATAAHLKLTPRMMKLLVERRQSLYATIDAKPHDHSTWGAMFFARQAEGIRTNEVQRYALKIGKQAADDELAATGDMAAAKLAQQKAYDDIVRRAANYHVGNVEKELGKILDARVKRQLDLLDTQMRVMQRHLVQQAEARGESLFDETGKFAGRFGQDDETFRMFGRDIYDESARIEQHNYLHSDNTEIDRIQAEYDARLARNDAELQQRIAKHRAIADSHDGIDHQAVLVNRRNGQVFHSPHSSMHESDHAYLGELLAEQGRDGEGWVQGWIVTERGKFARLNMNSVIPPNAMKRAEGFLAKDFTGDGYFNDVTERIFQSDSHFERNVHARKQAEIIAERDAKLAEASKTARIYHRVDEVTEYKADELRREVSRVKGYAARRSLAGKALPKGWVDDKINEKVAELDAAWQRAPEGWVDTREKLSVPAAYLRHQAEIYDAARARVLRENPGLTSDFVPDSIRQLSQIAVDPALVQHGSGIEGEMELLSWYLHSPIEMAGEDGMDYLRARPGVRQFRPNDAALRTVDANSLSGKIGEDFRQALYEHDVALRDGFDHALPKALLSEYAVWEAAMHAQSLPLKVAYGAMSAMLDAWIFTTLPLRLGFVVRNVVDNTAKMWVAGARDPRYYFLGAREPGKAVRSIFEADVNAIRYVLSVAGRYQQNPVLRYFDEIVETFWNHTSTVIQDIFKAHAIPVPERIIDEMRFHLPGRTETRIGRAKERIWDLMAARPENFAKRGLYRSTYYKAIENGATEEEAFHAGWQAIDHTLFDYGKVSVIEDNFRQIFPFVQFWRKTVQFWVGESFDKPWLPIEFALFQNRVRNDVHAGEPQWMRRYFDAAPITDALARVPGLLWLMPGLKDGAMTDPANFLSFNVLYKTFTNQNPNLPTDKKGLPFISGFIDAVNDWGLSMNPLYRKPLEMAGVLNYRAWQSVSPFTSLGDAFTKRFFGRDFNIEAYLTDWTLGPLADLLNLPAPDAVAKIGANFDQYVQQEMAGQAARGETVDRARAEDRIRKYFVVQNLIGFFGGVYLRRNTPSDFHLAKIADEVHHDPQAFASLSKEDQRAYRLFAKRKLDPLAFDRYLNALPQVEAFYLMNGDPEAREQFKQNHPEIIPYVTRTYPSRAFSDRTVANLALLADQDAAIRMYEFVDQVDVSHDARKIAESYFVDQELRDFWAANDTPRQIRDKTLKAQYFAHMSRLNDAYHTIPETDYDARASFIQEHPILGHWFNQNDSVSDDYRNVLNTTNAHLRDQYFKFLDAGAKPDWAGAHAFLKQFPFIFEFTKSEDKVSYGGDWIGSGGSGTQHSRDYMAAKSALDYYFSLSAEARRAFLSGGTPLAQTVKQYFDKYGKNGGGGGGTQHSRDYMAAKSSLDYYFSLNDTMKREFLSGSSVQAKQVRAYFARYGGGAHGKTQHAKDYLAAKPSLTIFFAVLKKDHNGAMAWLRGDTKAAKTVLAYFKKYAHPKGTSQHALDYLKVKAPLGEYFKLTDKAERRAFLDKHPEVSAYFKKWGHMTKQARNWKKLGVSDDPMLNARLNFWKVYYSLTPDERPQWVMDHAENDGVFVYGRLSDQERRASLHDYVIEAIKHGITRKSALYLRVKPLIDVYFTLSKDDQHLFLRANPDVASYLNEFSKPPSSGDTGLDSAIQSYFAMPPHSSDRTAFLSQHPDLQDYFDKHSAPADLAIRKVLDVYFALTDTYSKKRFAQQHPEMQLYFDKRKLERSNELAQASPFDLADPRLASYFTHGEQYSAQPAYQMLLGLRQGVANNKVGDKIETRTERRPAKSSSPRA